MSLDREFEPDWVDDYDIESDERDPDVERDRAWADESDRLYEECRDRQMGWDQ
ncbi:hypothetical protein NCCP2495_05800 [Dietzia sp. NCCP-2495]|uniref:hypothetical protein n=1 Tax=Dietzia sp. NCCP-2495 TaxID=2934675 RepID=UPI0022308330|nr:hypothetical protein [Dietzia sp. NCCP-2495]GLB62702.1 hypothetical protein NCCP2495_05800 [Dietzia sp. NCCP-2495]